MILYCVECVGNITNNEWSIVTIHKSQKGADIAMSQYNRNAIENKVCLEYRITEIDTDSESDIIYQYR